MPCVAAPTLPLPPGLDALLPVLVLSPPPAPGLNFCCTFEVPPIPGTPIILPLGSVPGMAVILQPVLTVIMAIIDLLNALLDELQFSCPLDG